MAASLANITNVWKEFNLVMFQSELDQVATELADRQENSEQSRKKLIEQNKEFKKNSTAETKKQVAPLLKSFQNEIDDLTNRSKAAEAAFLTVYKRIVEAPDPVPSLEFVQSIQTKASKVADLELENGKLRETLSEYNKEFAEVKNQEVTIKNLREKVKELEDSVESRVSSRLVEKERELAKSYEEKNQLIASSQVDLEKKLTESEHNSHALQSAYSAAQAELFELRSRLDEEQSGKNSEMELVLGDLEVANQKLAAADKEISDLHSQLSELKTMAASHEGHLSSGSNDNEAIEEAFQRYANTSLEAELVAKERQIEQLVDENRRLSGSVASGKQSLELQRHRHQQDYSALEQQLEAMKEKLHQQRDYAEIKRELNIMKSVEFGFASTGEETTGQDSNTSSSATPDLISGSVVSKQSLELLLLEKNKKLQNEATNLRNSNASLQGDSADQGSNIIASNSLSINVQNPLFLKSQNNQSLNVQVQSSCQKGLNLTSNRVTPILLRGADEGIPTSRNFPFNFGGSRDYNEDSDLESLTCNSESSAQSGVFGGAATSLELFNPAQIAEKVSVEIQGLGVSVKAVSRDLNLPNLRVLIEEPKLFHELSQIEFYAYLDLLKWLREQEAAREEQNKPKSDEETNEAIQRILASAKQEMAASQSSTEEQSKQGATDNGIEIKDIKTEIVEIEPVETKVAESSSSAITNNEKSPVLGEEFSIDASSSREEFTETDAMTSAGVPGDNDEVTSRSIWRKCPKVPGSRLTVLAQMRRMLLTPLTPSDVSKYSNCDTQILAEKVRRILENNSISQRVFGHYILGMSQSSVSDLLLHPKPWGLTTSKGQASYIRMQKWLEDSSGVERLKQLNSNFLSDVLSNMQQISEKKNTPNMTNDSIKTNNSTLQARSNNSAIQQLPKVQSVSSVAAPKATREVVLNVPKITPPRILPRPGPTVIRSESDLNDFLLFNSLNTESSRVEKMSTVRANRYCHSLKLAEEKAQALRMSNSTSHKLQIQAKSLHIISSCNVKSTKPRRSIKLTDEIFDSYSLYGLDTLRLTDQVKVLMSTRSIGQKVLGENILGLCQASVCDLLNKPRPWRGLHRRVKEAYIRLQIWANNPTSFPLVDSFGDSVVPQPLSSSEERLSVVEVELKMANRTTEEQSMLINQLEKDLSSVNQQFSKFRTEGDGAPNPPPPFSIEGSSDSDFTTEQKLLAAAVQEKVEESEPENTLLSIVSSQRERFKARNQELEVENKGYQQKISVLRGECDKLRTDNVQLYEKIKYLHSYNQSRSESGGGKNDVENRYSAEYENKLDPFTTFSQRERQRKYANLAGFEKVVLNVGQLIFSNRKARIMAFVYAMLLHALVFIVLWRFSLGATDISTFSQECQVKFASHMKEFHGHNDVMEAAGHLHELEGGGAAMEHAHVHAR